MNDDGRLRALLLRTYERRGAMDRISPAWLATEAIQKIDPDRLAPELLYRAAHLHLCQIARDVCRKWFQPDEDGEPKQHSLWPKLQQRYPSARRRGREPEYVLLERMTAADVRYNLRRLRREAKSKLEHADELEEWWKHQRTAVA